MGKMLQHAMAYSRIDYNGNHSLHNNQQNDALPSLLLLLLLFLEILLAYSST